MSLQTAAFESNVILTRKLISIGRNINELKHGHSALHVAAFHGSIDVAAELVKNGADVNIQLAECQYFSPRDLQPPERHLRAK